MEHELTLDEKFVRGLFNLLSFLMIMGTTLVAVFFHNWWLLLGIWLGAIGAAIAIVMEDIDKKL